MTVDSWYHSVTAIEGLLLFRHLLFFQRANSDTRDPPSCSHTERRCRCRGTGNKWHYALTGLLERHAEAGKSTENYRARKTRSFTVTQVAVNGCGSADEPCHRATMVWRVWCGGYGVEGIKGCDAAFLLYPQSNMVEEAVTCSWVPKSPGHHASRRQLSHQGSTRVTGLHPKKVKTGCKLYPAGTVTS